MSFLKNFMNSQKSGVNANWKNMVNEAELQQIIDQSTNKPAFIFKHSTSCGISVGAKSRLETFDIDSEKVDFYYLDLLEYRNISNKIAEDLNVVHQSPQVILVKDGKAVWSITHHAISAEALQNALEKH